MAGLVASSLRWTAEKLASLLSSDTSGSSSLPADAPDVALKNLEKLERTMRHIESILLDASDQSDIRDHSEKLRLNELKDVAYDAEDAVADYEYDVLHAKVRARNSVLGLTGGSAQKKKRKHNGKVLNLDFISISVPVSRYISGRVKEIRERFEEITGEWESFRLIESDGLIRHSSNAPRRPPTSSIVQESSVIEKEELEICKNDLEKLPNYTMVMA